MDVAVGVAARHRVDLEKIRRWSEHERALPKFEIFLEELERFRRHRKR